MAHATVIVRVMDVNDSPPQISINTLTETGEAEISESSKIKTFVAHVSVGDLDSGANGEVKCSLDSDKFKLEKMYKSQYKIVTAAEFDREVRDSYSIQLECEDGGEMPWGHQKNSEWWYLMLTIMYLSSAHPHMKQ